MTVIKAPELIAPCVLINILSLSLSQDRFKHFLLCARAEKKSQLKLNQRLPFKCGVERNKSKKQRVNKLFSDYNYSSFDRESAASDVLRV